MGNSENTSVTSNVTLDVFTDFVERLKTLYLKLKKVPPKDK